MLTDRSSVRLPAWKIGLGFGLCLTALGIAGGSTGRGAIVQVHGICAIAALIWFTVR